MSKSEEYVSSLLGAIDTIVGKRLQEMPYDKTIICTIIDDSKAKNGEYFVTNGTIKFWATCENTSYRNDEQVRVSISNNDATQKKFILGKYVRDSSTLPVTYVSPLDSILKMSENLIEPGNRDNLYGFKANDPIQSTLLWSGNLNKSYSNICDTIYISADFKCLLSHYNIISGNYGFVLVLGNNNSTTTSVSCVFDSTMMMGDPYSFGIFSNQAAKFNIANVSNITNVQLYFVQDNNFTHNTYGVKERVPLTDINNILIKNIQIGFGTDLTNITDETLKLYTTDSLYFDRESALNNQKNLYIAWYNKDENEKYVGFNDLIDENTGEVRFVDELEYFEAAKANDELRIKKDYNTPLDKMGLKISSDIEQCYNALSELGVILSEDLNGLITDLAARCNINQFQSKFQELSDLAVQQLVAVAGEEMRLLEAAEDLNTWYTDALNRAAALHNKELIPDILNGKWEFAYTGDDTKIDSPPDYQTAFSDFFDLLNNSFYQLDEETGETYFLKDLRDLISTYTGYKGVYDEFEKKFLKMFEKISRYQKRILSLLDDKNTKIMLYFNSDYELIQWSEDILDDYNDGYCLYWYRYNSESSGDVFMPQGWERIVEAGNSSINGISVTLDAETMEEEKFQVVLFRNHERYDSDVLIFENRSPIIDEATAILSDMILIKHGKNSQETYQNYNMANFLINEADRNKVRELEIQFSHGDGVVDNKALIGSQIYWYFPKNPTMLSFSLNDLLKLNKDNNFINDIEDVSEVKSEHYREGYNCFYKTIGYGLTEENLDNYVKDLKFAYRIKDYYSPASNQNFIICKVVKDNIIYEAEIGLTFAGFGTSGTDYSLTIIPSGDQVAVTADSSLELKVSLYNNKNIQIPFENSPKVRVLIGTSAYSIVPLFQKENDELSWYTQVSFSNASNPLCNILEVTTEVKHGAEQDLTVTLASFYTIPYSSDINYYIEGATTVIYNDQGVNPQYYKDPYNIFKQDVWNEETNSWDSSVPEHSWIIKYAPGISDNATETEKEAWESVKEFLPKLLNNALLPSNLWIDDGDVTYDEEKYATSHCPYVQCLDANGTVLWSQPILVIQNRYPSPALNAWDGKFKIDEQNGTILSTMIGAGKKTENNTFSGVLMGDIEAGADFNNGYGIGLYGFHDGSQSFHVGIDGRAFLGKSGQGRIYFNGNNGFIYSGNWINSFTEEENPFRGVYDEFGNLVSVELNPGKAGMALDLQSGHLDAHNFKLTSNGIKLNGNASEEEYYIDISNNNESIPEDIRGKYYIKFRGDGKLELSLSDADTWLADQDKTLIDYIDGEIGDIQDIVDNEISDIKDNLIGEVPDTDDFNNIWNESTTVYDNIKAQIDRVEKTLIGLDPNTWLGEIPVLGYVKGEEYLTIEGVFNGLTDGGEKKGIFALDEDGNLVTGKAPSGTIQDLYINASYISTGILRSTNWEGKLISGGITFNTIEEYEAALESDPSLKEKPVYLEAVQGTYWNLNDGQLWASNFELNAWTKGTDETSNKGLYINSNPEEEDSQYYFKLGEEGAGFLEYTGSHKLRINVNNFVLNAWTNQVDENGNDTSYGVYLNNDPDPGKHYFSIGENGNFIQLLRAPTDTEAGRLIIQSQDFVLDGWNVIGKNADGESVFGGIYLNSNPEDYGDGVDQYFKVGSDTYYLTYNKDNQLIASLSDFALHAWNESECQGVYINSNPQTTDELGETIIDYYLSIGNGHQYDEDGLVVRQADFIQLGPTTGLSINTRNLVLDAWDSNSYRGVYLNSDPDDLKTYFSVGNEDDFIQLFKLAGLSIKTHNLILDAWNDDKGIYLNSNPSSGSYLKVGDASSYISYDTNGELKVSGKLYAKEGEIGGWTIDTNSFYHGEDFKSADSFLCSTGSNASFEIGGSGSINGWVLKAGDHFGVTEDGAMYCNSGQIGGWTINETYLYCYANGVAANPINIIGKDDTVFLIPEGSNSNNSIAGKIFNSGSEKWVITAGAAFGVTNKGGLYCSKGKIGGWTIGEDFLYYWEQTGSAPVEETPYYLISNPNSFFLVPFGSTSTLPLCGYHPEEGNGWVLTVGENFGILKDGTMYCKDIYNRNLGDKYYGRISFQNSVPDSITAQAIGTFGMYNENNEYEFGLRISYNGEQRLSQFNANADLIFLNGTVYTPSSSIDESDKNAKNSIAKMSEQYETLFDNLNPVIFKYNNGTSDRYHTGFIAQEVGDAVAAAGLSLQDFAAVCISNPDTEEERWGLRYSEFVSLNTYEIQKLKARVAELEQKINDLQSLSK